MLVSLLTNCIFLFVLQLKMHQMCVCVFHDFLFKAWKIWLSYLDFGICHALLCSTDNINVLNCIHFSELLTDELSFDSANFLKIVMLKKGVLCDFIQKCFTVVKKNLIHFELNSYFFSETYLWLIGTLNATVTIVLYQNAFWTIISTFDAASKYNCVEGANLSLSCRKILNISV